MARFRLERLLRVRERVRQLRQHEAAALAAEVRRLERERSALAAAREQQADGERDSLARAPLDAASFVIGRLYDRGLADDEARRAHERDAMITAREAKRAEVTAARQEERKLERLREAHTARAAEERARDDERLLDEIAARGHRRRAGDDEDDDGGA